MFLTDITDKFEIIKHIAFGVLLYVIIMTILFFLLLFHVVDIHNIVEQLQLCVM